MTSLSVKLSKLCKQSSAFQMYKRGDMMKKIEHQGVIEQTHEGFY